MLWAGKPLSPAERDKILNDLPFFRCIQAAPHRAYPKENWCPVDEWRASGVHRGATGAPSINGGCASHGVKIEREVLRKMSEQYFYVRLKFTPKFGTTSALNIKEHEAAVEIPKHLVQRKQSELINENPREKVVALDIARRAALVIFSTGADPIVWPYDEDALWDENRHPVMNERPCDYEENGIRAWRIV